MSERLRIDGDRIEGDHIEGDHIEGDKVSTEPLVCSARDCRRPATWVLAWNNPKIHEPDRRKQWLACDEHRERLADFLRARNFLLDVTAR